MTTSQVNNNQEKKMKGSIRISFALALSLLSLLANAQETEWQ